MTDLAKSIIEELPQIPYVLDQVGEALAWTKEELDEGEYNRMLKTTYDVTEYVKTISDPHFFKVHYVIATILSHLENPLENPRFSKFDSASGAIEKALRSLTVPNSKVEEKGCFKSLMLHLIPLAKENIELFTIILINIKNDISSITEGIKKAEIKSPITSSDYVTVLGYALVMANIRMANLTLAGGAHKIFNDITIMLNNDLNY